MKHKKTLEEVISEFYAVHGDRYDYSKVVYTGRENKVEIVCKDHGPFLMLPRHHLAGNNCIKCRAGRSKKQKTNDQFLSECHTKFGNKFKYLTNYQPNDSGKVTIECPDHGQFDMRCRVHLKSDYGCPMCASEQMDRGVGSIGCINFKVAEKNKHIPYYVYLLRLWDDNESFFKVGLTKVGSESRRLRDIRRYYNVEIITLYEYPLDIAFELEQFILSEVARYKPSKMFGGYTECFKSINTSYFENTELTA